MMSERPQRAVSAEAQRQIAANLDADAQQAADMGYPETAENLRQKAKDYRAATGQQ